jgi:hypothetical protein
VKIQPRLPQLTRPLETKPQATEQAAAAAKPDSFARGDAKQQVSLTMPPPPASVDGANPLHPPESPWYRFKKHVVLFLTGIDYDPHVHRLDDEAVRKLSEVLRPGDVILRRTDGTTSNWVIPGYWGHAALYAGDGKIVDATTHDVREVDLAEFCSEGDAAIVVRPKGMSQQQIAEAIEFAARSSAKPTTSTSTSKTSRASPAPSSSRPRCGTRPAPPGPRATSWASRPRTSSTTASSSSGAAWGRWSSSRALAPGRARLTGLSPRSSIR